MRDFTLHTYQRLLLTFRQAGYVLLSFEEYLTSSVLPERFVILRHDIDKRAAQALKMATLEHEMGVHASYYFRVSSDTNQPHVICQIADWGFEIGYHYEDMAHCTGNVQQAYEHFKHWLAYFRQFYPVRTICMHGSPRSPFDAKELWKHYDYHESGVLGEPYLDTDFSRVCYLTDTGRRWDGYQVSVRDKIVGFQQQWIDKGWTYHSTNDVIKALLTESMPKQLMLVAHPQRWDNAPISWLYELVRQNSVNLIKRWWIKHKHMQ